MSKRPRVLTSPSPSMADHERVIATIPAYKMFCFKDSKTNLYGPPITVRTRGLFIREIQEVLKQPLSHNSPKWAQHPKDFSLFEVGEFDENSGSVSMYDAKTNIGLVDDYVVQQPQA